MGPFWGIIFREKWAKVTEGLSNLDVSEFIRVAPVGSPETGQEVRPGTSLPRAGGQDDVSLNKLPQINCSTWIAQWRMF